MQDDDCTVNVDCGIEETCEGCVSGDACFWSLDGGYCEYTRRKRRALNRRSLDDFAFVEDDCVIRCAAYDYPEGVTDLDGANSCRDTSRLLAGESCWLACEPGYSQSGSGILVCPGDAYGEDPSTPLTCTEIDDCMPENDCDHGDCVD
eukprot:UN28728